MAPHERLDPRAKPPLIIRETYKRYQKKRDLTNCRDGMLIDFNDSVALLEQGLVRKVGCISEPKALEACNALEEPESGVDDVAGERPMYEHAHLPGLLFVPSALPPRTQKQLLSKLLHRDLSNPQHLTNVHFHHRLPYASLTPQYPSYFHLNPSDPANDCLPLDPAVHKSIPLSSFLTRKLRWTTLGGQYDWSAKRYPDEPPPPFPRDVARLLETLFPEMKAQAAIVNLYSPGDVLSMHRDVAEQSDRGLVSVSLGCDAIFVIGLGDEGAVDGEVKPPLVVRLRSGDAVFMGGASRFAWHGVPQIIPHTCPEFLKDWPACSEGEDEEFEHWRGWMANKRVNLNVRQMWD